MINSIPYVLLLLAYMLLAYCYKFLSVRGKQQSVMLCILLYLLFFGFRGLVGDDWTVYYYFFQDGAILGEFDFLHSIIGGNGFELGFMLLISFVKTSFDDYQFFVFVCALINCILLFSFLKKYAYGNPIQGLVFFVCMGGFILQTDLMRNSISILIFLNSLQYIKERRVIRYFILCFVALLFHSSSLLFFPLYYFFHKRCPRVFFGFIFLVGNIVFLFQFQFITPLLVAVGNLLGNKYAVLVDVYVNGEMAETSYGITIGYLERLLTGGMIFIYYDKLLSKNGYSVMFVNAYIAYFIFFFFFSEISVIGVRLGNLFVFSYWILWGELLQTIALKNNKRLFGAFIYIYCLLKIVGLSSHPVWRYDNVLWGTQSYEERFSIRERSQENE